MKKILFLITLIPIIFIGSSCNSGGGGGSGSEHDSGHDTTACIEDISGKWQGLTFSVDYDQNCGITDINNEDITEVLFDFNFDETYEFESNGNSYIEDEEGSWSCDGGPQEVYICETGDDCDTWEYELNDNQAIINNIIHLDTEDCNAEIIIVVEKK